MERHLPTTLLLAALLAGASPFLACSSAPPPDGQGGSGAGSPAEEPTYRSDVTPVTSVDQAKPGVFIPPFLDCRDPKPGEVGQGPDGKVCTHVMISACTEPGKSFADYASCDVVKTQRPFFPRPPAGESDPADPRLNDPVFMGELAWVAEQVSACGCVCCHDGDLSNGKAGSWDIKAGPIWTDSLSSTGLALFLGLADSSVLGAYDAEDNHGFDRTTLGLPTTDIPRMTAFFMDELARRGITPEEAAETPPFGGPIYDNYVAEPTECDPVAEGVDAQGLLNWWGGAARYVYVLEAGSKNPGVPPNLDVPQGTVLRLDVLASSDPIYSGVPYGTTPAGTFQAFPEATAAPKLVPGKRYQLVALRDMGLMMSNCLFTYQGS